MEQRWLIPSKYCNRQTDFMHIISDLYCENQVLSSRFFHPEGGDSGARVQRSAAAIDIGKAGRVVRGGYTPARERNQGGARLRQSLSSAAVTRCRVTVPVGAV